MTNKDYYSNGKHAISEMENILGDIWRQIELMPFYNKGLECINKNYCKARDAAIAFGEDINKYPKKIRWRTNGLEIIGDVL